MKAVVQRVSRASLKVDGIERAAVPAADELGGNELRPLAGAGGGLVVLVGLEEADTVADREWMADKLVNLRIFPDGEGKMNRSVLDVGGTIMLVPNFTVAGSAQRGRRPSFDRAMKPEYAESEFAKLVDAAARLWPRVSAGVFRAHMQVSLTNDGPVTILLDSRERGSPP